MNIKKFTFPSFEEWNTSQIYRTNLADYYLSIGAFSWDNSREHFILGIACLRDPINMWSKNIFSEQHIYEYDNPNKIVELEKWYNQVTIKANEAFEKYMITTYFE